MNIQTNDEKNTIPVTEDDAFSYDGYQVVRGEFFAHTYEPSFTFNSSKVSVNTACIKKLPDTDFVPVSYTHLLYKIDGITSYIKGFFLTPKPSNRRGIQVSPV